MYGPDFAEIYDLIYTARGKDYRAEADTVTGLIRDRRPAARSLLDVACGTGAHLRHFRRRFEVAEGLEISEPMIRKAAEAVPGVRVHRGDMRRFRLGRRYDAVVCMFSSIGYLGTTEELDEALRSFAAHLTPGGVIVLEPWYFPEAYTPGYIARTIARTEDRVAVRMSHSTREGDHVRIDAHYIDAQRGHGIKHYSDVHRMTLFGRRQYEHAFAEAGCTVTHLAVDGFACGLFIGRAAGPPPTSPGSSPPG